MFGIMSAAMIVAGQSTTQAQSIIANPDNTGTTIIQNGQTYHIQGGQQAGANLFHSFQTLGLTSGEIANFLSNPSIMNIFGRITGGDPSMINGLLQVTGANSNLYLMNPAGFVFGNEARLNVGGDFFATTADRIGFNGGAFNAFGENDYTTLIGAPNQFLFLQENPSAIINTGVLSSQNAVHLSGGTVLNEGRISAAVVTLAAIPGTSWVNLSQPGLLLSLDLPSSAIAPSQPLNPLTLPALLTGAVTNEGSIQGDRVDLYGATGVTTASPDDVQGETRVIRWSETGENPSQAVFIDGRVSSPETLLFGGAAGTVTQLVNGDENGVTAVGEGLGAIAASVGELESVAIVAEGNVGTVWLGNQWLKPENFSDYGANLATWGDALTDNGDLLLYGSGTVSGGMGMTWLNQGAIATGADVAASVDATGHATLNGNWTLEAQTGTIEAANPFTTATLSNWEHTLSALTVTDTADTVANDGELTLREAILAANTGGAIAGQQGNAGTDKIRFDTTGTFATPQTITLQSDLDTITEDLVITGPGEDQLAIDGDGVVSNIFNAETPNFTVEQLTLQNAATGIYHSSPTGELTVNHVTITDMGSRGIERDVRVPSASDSIFNPSYDTRVTVNHATLRNAGILSDAAIMEIHDTQITGNSLGIHHVPWFGMPMPPPQGRPKPVDEIARLHITDSAIANLTGRSLRSAVRSGRGDVIIERTTIADIPLFASGSALRIDHRDRNNDPAQVIINDSLIARNSGSIDASGMTIRGTAPMAVTLARTEFVDNEGGTLQLRSGQTRQGVDDIYISNGNASFAITDSVGDVNLDMGGAAEEFKINSRGAINLSSSLVVQGDLSLIAEGDINTSSLTTTRFGEDGGDVTLISRQGSINTTSNGSVGAIYTRSLLGNGGQVTLQAAGEIVTGAINTEAQAGAGGRVTLQSDDTIRIDGTVESSFVDFPASISTAGATQGGTITIRHGGQGIIPFIVGDARVNGTSDAIAAGSGFTVATTQRFLLEHRQPGILITPGLINTPLDPVNTNALNVISGSDPVRSLNPIDFTVNADVWGFIAGANPVRPLNIFDFVHSMARQMGATVTNVSYGDQQHSSEVGEGESILLSITENVVDAWLRVNGLAVQIEEKGVNQPNLGQVDQLMSDSFKALLGNESLEGESLDDESAVSEEDASSDEDDDTNSVANIREIFQRITAQTGTVPALVYAISQPDFLELIVITPDNQLRRVVVPEGDRATLRRTIAQFRRAIQDKTDDYLIPAQQLYDWLIRPIEATIDALDVDNLVFSMGEDLRALPLAALHDGDRFLIEKYSIGQIPSLSLTNSDYQPLHDASVLSMGASEFKTLEPLPAVPAELAIVQAIKPSVTYLNAEFTWDNLYRESNQRQFEIVHLATHAEFQRGSATNAYIQLWGDERITLKSLRELDWHDAPQVELLVLSACLTALGDSQAELGFAGLAVQAGVKSVLASLWQISDVGTLQLMHGFYEHLHNPQITTKAEALRQAQLAMIRGDFDPLNRQDIRATLTPEMQIDLQSSALSHPYYWSSFLLVGSPW